MALTCGDTSLSVSVLCHRGNPRLLHLRRGDQPEGPELAKGDLGWTEVRTVDADGKHTDGLLGKSGWSS